ncbi:PD40 domain-containing protein, partial [bacterium]|nr:PD40 domain-containing protein [bacterium]
MKYKVSTLLLFMIIMVNFCMYENTSAQSFGKNKVQYKNFEWYYLQSEHFDVHFYKGGEEIAEFVAETAETSLILIQNSWSYRLKKRVPIILYKSHNDFQQTNVIQEYLGEGIGGVTELFKNRITIPYEGSYSQFRHVIHHELVHAVMFDMYYGGMFPGSIYSSAAFQVPLWVAEGIAEYESTGWNTETDMFNRDAAINGYLEYSGHIYNPYWGGNLMFHFIAKKFGEQKVGELIRKLKNTNSLDRGLKAALGMDYEELVKQFSLYSRRRYWPDIADRKTPEEFSKRLTDHKKMKNFYNMSPALSPDGNKIAFMSDKSGKFDIYIMSAIDGKILSKVIKGEKSADFEEMHILAPGISWSPDGKHITLAAKSGKEDALYIVNAKNKSSKQFKFGLDGIFESAWSPTDDEIAFIGTQNGHSNIYAYNINTKNLRKITDDVFTEKHIMWSSDGEKIAFISDRRDYTKPEMISDEFEMYNFDYSQFDVYTANKDGSDMQRITFTEYDEFSPAWSSDGKTIAHVAEANGIGNIFLTNIETKKSRPITNLLSGCQQLNWSRDGSKLAYVSFSDMGYDIYMIKNPLDIDSDEIELKNTVYFDELEKEKKKDDTEETVAISDESGEDLAPNMSKFIFDRSLSDNNISLLPKSEFEEKKPESKESGGKGKEYKIKKYKLKFSPDVIMGNAGYDTYFGVQGTSIVQITDILGNHQIQIGTDLYFDLRNSNYYIFYGYLSRRTDYMVGIYQDARYFTGY